jgi:MFS family permease
MHGDNRPTVPLLAFFLASFTWNYGLGMTYVVVPLYAHSQGLSGVEIGALFSMPVFAQVVFNLLGGAWTDRAGGRRIMLGSCWLLSGGALVLIFAHDFWMLFAGQLLLVLARATYWPATWALASELPGERSVQLGRLNSTTNFGQIVGTASAGFLLAAAGYTPSFLTLAGMGLAAFALGLATHEPARKGGDRGRSVFAGYRELLRLRIMFYAMMCAYLSALPFSLSMSFYPLLLKDYGFAEQPSGLIIALRAVGAIGAGLLLARFVKSGPASLAPVVAGLAVALSVGLLPSINNAAPISALMLVAGVGSSVMTLYFQITMSEISTPAQRGSALALGGLGWGLSHLSTPLAMGWLADRYGMASGFYVIGAFAVLWTILIGALRPWAFTRPTIAGQA